jgi:hypothetical protein
MGIISSISGVIWNLIAGEIIDAYHLTHTHNYNTGNVKYGYPFINIRLHLEFNCGEKY